ARVLQIAEPEAAVEVGDAHHLLDPRDLADHRVRRADDQEAIEQIVDIGFLWRRHRDRAAALDALVLVAQRQRDAHVPARLFGGGPRAGLAPGDEARALHAHAQGLRSLNPAAQTVKEPADPRHALDRAAEPAGQHVEAAAHRGLDRFRALRRDP